MTVHLTVTVKCTDQKFGLGLCNNCMDPDPQGLPEDKCLDMLGVFLGEVSVVGHMRTAGEAHRLNMFNIFELIHF